VNPTTGGQVQWLLTPGSSVEWLSVVVEAAEPSPEARICYTATSPPPAVS